MDLLMLPVYRGVMYVGRSCNHHDQGFSGKCAQEAKKNIQIVDMLNNIPGGKSIDYQISIHTILFQIIDISCYASKQLDAKVSGSGDIEYKGNPTILNKQGRKDSISRK